MQFQICNIFVTTAECLRSSHVLALLNKLNQERLAQYRTTLRAYKKSSGKHFWFPAVGLGGLRVVPNEIDAYELSIAEQRLQLRSYLQNTLT